MNTAQLCIQPELRSTLTACKQRLVDHYGTKMSALVLYGSAARQQLNPNSDIDLLVLLTPPFNHFTELRKVVDLLYPLQLESTHWISARPASLDEFENYQTQLYRNIQKEGMVL